MKPIALSLLAAALDGAPAAGQDMLSQARTSYASLSGAWIAPGLTCANPADTWAFGMDGVRAGSRVLDLIGIGGSPGAVRLDLVDRLTGRRTPLAVTRSGDGLSVRGSGISTVLIPCEAEDNRMVRIDPDFGLEPFPPGSGLATDVPLGPPDPGLPPLAEDDGEAAEASFATELAGPWSGSAGACDWRLGSDRIFAGGEGFEVVNFSGNATRIGIQALRDDGTPATFTVTRTGPSTARVEGRIVGGSAITASLTRC